MYRLLLLAPLVLVFIAGVSYVRLGGQKRAEALPPLTALADCTQRAQFPDRVACYRPILEPQLEARGPRAVLADLDGLQSTSAAYAAHCHDMAHVLGRHWIRIGRRVADGFHEGSNVCHSGFYHGMVERVIRGDAADTASGIGHASPDELRGVVATVCDPPTLGSESKNFRFQCLHGLGHAVVFSLGYRLPLALELCDALPDAWSRRSCHGGAFMENITGVERERRMLRAGDPHYPCTEVAEKYRDACYVMQTSWMIEMGLSLDEVVAACREAGSHRLACFQSYGRDLSPRARQESAPPYAARCAALAPDERMPCVRGAVYALADHTWDGRYAFPFCVAFADDALRQECFRTAQGHLAGSLEQPRAKLEQNCQQYVPGSAECTASLPFVKGGVS